MIIFLKAHIDTYTKKDGTVVAAHEDKRAAAKHDEPAKLTAELFQRAKDFVGQIEKAAEEHGSVFIRWSASEKHDLSDGAASRDYVSGETHSGLSAVEVTGDMHPVTIANRLSEYGFVRMSNRSSRPKVYLGEKIGVDSDGYTSIKATKKLMDVPDDVLFAIDKKFADAFDLEDDINDLTDRLKNMGNTAAAQITRNSLEKKQSELEKIMGGHGAPMTKSHPATQAMSAARAPADLMEPGLRRNPGEPSAAEAEASSYNKPRIQWQGLTIAVENPAGSVRRGRNRHGVTWEVRMRFDYGEVAGSMGVDGDPVDIYMGPNPDAPMVYVVHQRRVNDWDAYDEDKVMAGFDCQSDAEAAFLSNYNDPRFLGPVTAMPVAEFVAKVRATKDKPAMIKAAAPVVLFFKAHVGAYLRGGKMVNVNGYQGRAARAVATPGQLSLFGANKPMGQSPFKGRDPVASTPDMFDADEHGEVPAGRPAKNLGIPEKSTKPIVNDRAGDLARRLRDSVDKSAKDDATKSRMYASEAQRLRGAAGAVRTTPDVAKQYSEAADILDAWAKTLGGKAATDSHPTETPQFKRWFGDSKVVDADGKPLVVYHGTAGDFSEFSAKKTGAAMDAGKLGKGFYFSESSRWAGRYAESAARKGGAANVMPVFISLKNPLILSGSGSYIKQLMSATEGWNLKNQASMTDEKNPAWPEEFTQAAQARGFDGVVLPSEYGETEYVAFRPEQIKSATGNNGDFDAKNPNLTKAIMFLRHQAS